MRSASPGEDIWEKVFRKSANVVSRKIAGELFLVPIRGNLADMQHIFALNAVAEYIWQELGEKSLNDIRDGVMANFDVEKGQAEADIRDFIDELLQENLIAS